MYEKSTLYLLAKKNKTRYYNPRAATKHVYTHILLLECFRARAMKKRTQQKIHKIFSIARAYDSISHFALPRLWWQMQCRRRRRVSQHLVLPSYAEWICTYMRANL